RIVSFTEGDTLLVAGRDFEFASESGIVTRLCGGSALPLQQPADPTTPNAVIQYDAGWKIPDEADESDGESLLYDAPDVEMAVRKLVVSDFKAKDRDMMERERSGAGG